MNIIFIYIVLAIFVFFTVFLLFFSVKAFSTIKALRERNKKYSYFLDKAVPDWRHTFSKEL